MPVDGIDDPDWHDVAQRYQRALLVIAASDTLPADRLRMLAHMALRPDPPSQEVRYHPRTLPIPFGWREVAGADLGHHGIYSILIERVPR